MVDFEGARSSRARGWTPPAQPVVAVVVETTLPDRARAQRLADTLVAEHMAACVQVVGPIESTYMWEGSARTDTEWLLRIKTHPARAEEVKDAILRTHPYAVPEVLVFGALSGASEYLMWISETVVMGRIPPGRRQ